MGEGREIDHDRKKKADFSVAGKRVVRERDKSATGIALTYAEPSADDPESQEEKRRAIDISFDFFVSFPRLHQDIYPSHTTITATKRRIHARRNSMGLVHAPHAWVSGMQHPGLQTQEAIEVLYALRATQPTTDG